MKPSQQSLKRWTEQEWTTSDGSPSKGTKRYLPKAAWSALSPGEKAATNAAKAKGNAKGKQVTGLRKQSARVGAVSDRPKASGFRATRISDV